MPVRMDESSVAEFLNDPFSPYEFNTPTDMVWNSFQIMDNGTLGDYASHALTDIEDMFAPPFNENNNPLVASDCMWSEPDDFHSRWLMNSIELEEEERFSTITLSVEKEKKAEAEAARLAINLNSTASRPVLPVRLHQVPPGRSLLRSSCAQMIDMSTDKFGTRPDTPISLNDETPEFKHQIDLCSTISDIKRERTDSTDEILLYNEFLRSPSKEIPLPQTKAGRQDPTDVFELITELSDYEDSDSSDNSSPCGSINVRPHTGGKNGAHFHQTLKSHQDYQETSFGDHSYTRPKDRFDTRDLGVQTPSDSEEDEIDIINVNERTLPTNPSARDRRNLQNTVANKISARMVKTQKNGLRTIPPRRRISDDTPSSSNSPSKAWSGMTTPVVQPVHRKRPTIAHHAKKNRGKKNAKAAAALKRLVSDTDEAETLEKRNLHNDMERQRRIGLKNLFDELKSTIPAIRDKERAPKVHILREAAALCKKLTHEDDQHQALRKYQIKLKNKLRQLSSGSNRRYE